MDTEQPDPTDIHTRMTDQILDAIRGIRGPADRVFTVENVRHNNGQFSHQLAKIVREAVAEMHQTKSYAEIGAELGISRARAQQLANGR